MAGEIAERFVEEWLNRKGFMTIRQVTIKGNRDMDILACRIRDGELNCRHYEVQAADKPIGFIANGGKLSDRSTKKMKQELENWLNRKFRDKAFADVRRKIANQKWTYHLIIHKVKHPEELKILKEIKDVKVKRLCDVRKELKDRKFLGFKAGERQLVNLVLMDCE